MKHAKPVKHYTATAYVFSDSIPRKVLLLHHKKFDKWMPPGGHQEDWENPVEAVIREVQEETGLDISSYLDGAMPIDDIGRLIPRPNYLIECDVPAHGKEPHHFHLDQAYVVRIPEQAPVLSKTEAKDVRWFTLEETDELPMINNVRVIVKQEMTQL